MKSQILKTVLISFVFMLLSNFNAKAQSQYSIQITNTASLGCDWVISIYNSSSTLLAALTSTGLSGYVVYNCATGVPDYITVSKSGCTTITFGSGGSFPFSAVIPPTCSPSSCASEINCSGGPNTPQRCSDPVPIGDFNLIVEIK